MDVLRPTPLPIHVDTSLFRGGQKARDSDVFIALMGLTGSGKSTFVSHLTKSTVAIGSNLQSCTSEVTVYWYQYDNSTNVYLVDTPGFDDVNLSDSDVLEEIAAWLTGSYNNEVKLTGILYLHRIIDFRMGGSARKNLFMFKKLCGPEALKHVVLVTTMWELVDEKTGLKRQAELETTEDFWGYMLAKGSRIEKHMNTPESAHHIISTFMSHSRLNSPSIQDEMVNKNKTLDETEAGKGLEGVLAKEREEFKRDLDQSLQETQEAISARDRESQEELIRQQALAERNLERLRLQQEEMKTTMENLHREKYEKLEADWKKHKKEMDAKNEKRKAQGVQEREELNSKMTSLSARMKNPASHGKDVEVEVEAVKIPAWDRTISLSLRGQDWAFIGPYLSKWSASEEITEDITSISKGDWFRIKKLILGDGTDSYFSHHHTGVFVTRCNYHGRVRECYPGLYEFLNSKGGTECPKSISLGPEGSYFISTRKKTSFNCHLNTEIDFQAGHASRIWWGFEGAYVMEMQDTTVVMNLRGHYGTLGETLMQKINVRIKELAMDIHGGKAFALIMEDRTVKFETNGEEPNWDVPFKEYMTVNFGKIATANALSASPLAPEAEEPDFSLELAHMLYHDKQMQKLYSETLRQLGKDSFIQKNDSILHKYLADLRRSTSLDLYRRVLLTLAKPEWRRQIIRAVITLIQSDNPREFKDLEHGDERGLPIKERLARLLGNLHIRSENTGATDDDDQSDLEPEDQGDESDEDNIMKGKIPLEMMKEFFLSGIPFDSLKSRLEYLCNPPSSIPDALASGGPGLLTVYLEKRFQRVATGDYQWIAGLKDIGHSYTEISELLYQAHHDRPWIYFDALQSPEAIKLLPQPDSLFHLMKCAHTTLRDGGTPRSIKEPMVQFDDEGEVRRQFEELCGLSGVIPNSRNHEEWYGSIAFEEDNSVALVSHKTPHEKTYDAQSIAHRLMCVANRVGAAAGVLQKAGFCCDSLTVLLAVENKQRAKMKRINFSCINDLATTLRDLWTLGEEGEERGREDRQLILSSLRSQSERILSDMLSFRGKNQFESGQIETLHLTSLSIQILSTGLSSYFQAHIGEIRPFFLDSPLRKLLLLGLESPSNGGKSDVRISVCLTRLTCLNDMVGDEVMVFYGPASNNIPGKRFDVCAKPEDILDTWGPGHFVCHKREQNVPVAIKIGGGFIFPSQQNENGPEYHWATSLSLPATPFALELRREITIGTIIHTNGNCNNDEESCWQAASSMNMLGTYKTYSFTSGYELGVQGGPDQFNFVYTVVRTKQRGVTIKDRHFSQLPEDDRLIELLENHWGVRVSYCTGVAQRVPLRQMVGDLFCAFADSCTRRDDAERWTRLQSNQYRAIERFSGQRVSYETLRNWLRELEPPLHSFVLGITRQIIGSLKDTGISPCGRFFSVAWPCHNTVDRCLRLTLNNDFSKWMPILAESDHCATFAYVTSSCLETSTEECRGSVPGGLDKIPLLETAVRCRSWPGPAQWTLDHQKSYFFDKMDDLPCWVRAEKDPTQSNGPTTLVRLHRLGSIGSDMKYRVIEFLRRSGQQIQERELASNQAEVVCILSKRLS